MGIGNTVKHKEEVKSNVENPFFEEQLNEVQQPEIDKKPKSKTFLGDWGLFDEFKQWLKDGEDDFNEN